MSAAVRLGAAGFGLIAVCYGFARFAFGLFLPQISAELDLPDTLGGVIAAGSFVGFCLAIVCAAWLTERAGPRPVAVAAGVLATLGLAGVASASSAQWLGASMIVAGSSSGLASPALAAAVAAVVAPARQGLTNTVVNAGTSAGVALSGPIAVLMGAEWRIAFACFAGATALMAWAAFVTVPRRAATSGGERAGALTMAPELRRLCLAAFLAGAASAVVWTFGADLLALHLDWGAGEVGQLWTVMGLVGIVGAAAGSLIARVGIRAVHLVFHLALACSIVAVGYGFGQVAIVYAGGALFSAAYLMLTGVYLVWGISALPARPAAGVTIAFLALAIGQAVGAAGFGIAMDLLGANGAVLAFASLAVVASCLRQARRANDQVDDSIDDRTNDNARRRP